MCGDFIWRVSDCEELVWDEIQLPVQSVIRTSVRKKLWRLGLQFPRSCMDKLILNADKNADKFGAALTNPWYCWACVAGSTGLEPAASGVTGRRSDQLNYDPGIR